MRKDPIHKFKKVLSASNQIAIITHWSPDGDAMGSSLGLYHYLKKKGKNCRVIVPNDYPSFLFWLPGNKSVLNFQLQAQKVAAYLEKADLIFTLDFNTYSRIEELGKLVAKSTAKKILIDHHRQPENFADFYFHDIEASSTAELIFEFISGLDSKDFISKNIATCLYTGIMTDTGNFRFPSTQAKTHRTVAFLMECGAVNHKIYNAIFDENTENRLKLLGFCLSEKMQIVSDLHTAIISLSEHEHDKFYYQKGDTEGVVNYPLSVRGIHLSVFLAERDGLIKISFRSKGNFDVNLFARKYFSGGGHKNAAGGKSDLSLNETIKNLLNILSKYKANLQIA